MNFRSRHWLCGRLLAGVLLVILTGFSGVASAAKPATSVKPGDTAAKSGSTASGPATGKTASPTVGTAATSAETDIRGLLNDALRLVYSGKAAEAFNLLSPLEDQYAGIRDFDYLLGVAALDGGHLDIAVFALQRAVATDPKFSGARMDLARAYYNLEQYSYALEEFRIIQAQNPPQKIIDSIQRYQQAIDKQRQRRKTRYSAYVETAAGYDSNANSGPDRKTYRNVPLDEPSRQTSSPYTALSGGGFIYFPFSESLYLNGAMNLKRRVNSEAAFVNSTLLDGNLALRRLFGPHSLRLTFAGYQNNVNGEFNSRNENVSMGWEQQLNQFYQLSLVGRYGRARYQPLMQLRDVDQKVWSLQLTRTMARPAFLETGLVLNTSNDFRENGSTTFERSYDGGRVYAMLPLASAWALNLAGGYVRSDYPGPYFGKERHDIQKDATMDLRWVITKGWQLRGQVVFISNKSNIKIYEYDKTDTSINLRWNFVN